MDIMKRELKNIVELDGSEKTWIGSLKEYRFRQEPIYEFIRCIADSSKERKTAKMSETNNNYEPRYWTNLPPFWDNHAVVTPAPETVWKHEYCRDAFEDYNTMMAWLGDNAYDTYNDGCTEWHGSEFEDACERYVDSCKDDCEEISYEKWLTMPPEDDDDDYYDDDDDEE